MKRTVIATVVIIGCLATEQVAHAAVLVGYWPFEEEQGGTVFDHSGSSNHGALTGATRSEGKVGRGLSFDGHGGVTVPHSPSLDSLPGGFTLSTWIYPTSFPEYTTLFFKTDRDNRIHQLHFQVGDNLVFPVTEGHFTAAMNQSAHEGGFGVITPHTIQPNAWHYVAWTYDEAVHRLYDNGVEISSTPFTDPWVGNDRPLLIGEHPVFSYAHFYGLMDEPRIYRGALTQDELLRDMNAGLSPIVPEPSSLFLLGPGLLSLVGWRRRRVSSSS